MSDESLKKQAIEMGLDLPDETDEGDAIEDVEKPEAVDYGNVE